MLKQYLEIDVFDWEWIFIKRYMITLCVCVYICYFVYI
jgi:hypothetical protein